MDDRLRKTIKDTIQDSNLNFLLGSGLSCPFLITLGTIESLLTELDKGTLAPATKHLIQASLYKTYFDGVMAKNMNVLKGSTCASDVLNRYRTFLTSINTILLRRESTILGKEVNVFTTNIDICLEKTLEDLSLEYNDGFNGRFKPCFDLNNFKKSRFKKSLHYDNTAEIPVFNLLKLHGSLSWQIENDKIILSADLGHIQALESLPISPNILDVPQNATMATLETAAIGKTIDAMITEFMNKYEQLPIVNPTKEKFKHTLLNLVYYELLRLYANELEKENTVLFVLGFSFADEHIRQITLRAANSNPTLMIYVIAYNSAAKTELEAHFDLIGIKNQNIVFIAPPQIDDGTGTGDKFQYDLSAINKDIFGALFAEEDESHGTIPRPGY